LPPVSGERQITVYPAQTKQTVREVGGGNFQHQIQNVTDAVDPVGALNIKTLNPRYVRVNMGLDDWEPRNDNSYPRSINWSAFRESDHHTATLKLMKDRAKENATFVASIWDVPDWVVSNPDSRYRRSIKTAMYPEVAESIVAWILHAKRNHGITVHYVSINEPDIGVFVQMPAEDYAPLIVETGKRLQERGLSTRWLLADTSILSTCQQYAATVWSRSEVRPYIGPLSCHSYDQWKVSDQVIQDLGQFAQARGRAFWIGEAQWRAQLDPELYPTWENALNLSVAYSRLLKEGRVSVLFYWQMLRNGFSNNDGKEPYPSLDMLAQLQREIPAGARIVATSPNTESLFSLAAKTSSHLTFLTINTEDRTLKLKINALPHGTYYHVASSEAGTLRLVRAVNVTTSQTTLIVGPRSVNVLTTQPPSK
jgi:O-glycosyl hydrolase